MIFDSTSIRSLMACERRFYWRHVRHVDTRERKHTPEFGIAIHNGLETWYKTNDPVKAIQKFHETWVDDEGQKVYTHENGEALLREYFKKYGKFSRDLSNGVAYKEVSDPILSFAPNEPFEVLGLEQSFACPFPTEGHHPFCPTCSLDAPQVLSPSDIINMDKGEILCRGCKQVYEIDIYCGRFDGVIQWGDLTLVIDHKTTGKLGDGSYYFKQFRPNLQMSGYVWAAQKIFGKRIHGVLINALHITTRTLKFARDISSREPFEIEKFEQIVRNEILRTKAKNKEDMEEWSENWTSCMDFRGCPYVDLCLTQDPERIVDNLYVDSYWNPLNHLEEKGVD